MARRIVKTSDTCNQLGEVAARPPYLSKPGSTERSRGQRPGRKDALLARKYQALARKHLGRLSDRLFAEFTGVHFHVAWAPATPRRWDGQTLPSGCVVCCRLARPGLRRSAECQRCGPKHLARTLKSTRGHRFHCHLGVRNCWFPIRVRSQVLGIAYLQALEVPTAKGPAGNRLARAAQNGPGWSGARVLSRLELARAAGLLRLIVQHVQAATMSELRKEDLTKARQALAAFRSVQARLRGELKRVVPALRQTPPAPQPASRPGRLVHAVLDRIHQNYAQPLTLKKCADDLRVNTAYLSHLFAQATGLPFKTYLTELRIEEVRELLSDPTKSVAEVAHAVGYANGNRLRIAFKKVTGLSPRLWRETLQMPPAAP